MKFKTKLAIAQAKKHGIQLESVQTDKGVLHYVDELAPGVDVWIEETEGISKMADEGDYIAGQKIIHINWGSTVDSIIDTTKLNPSPEPSPDPEPVQTDLSGQNADPTPSGTKNEPEPKRPETKLAAQTDPAPAPDPTPEPNDSERKYVLLRGDIDDLTTSMAELFADVKEIKDSIVKVDAELSKAMKLSKSGFIPPIDNPPADIDPVKENIRNRFK